MAYAMAATAMACRAHLCRGRWRPGLWPIGRCIGRRWCQSAGTSNSAARRPRTPGRTRSRPRAARPSSACELPWRAAVESSLACALVPGQVGPRAAGGGDIGGGADCHHRRERDGQVAGRPADAGADGCADQRWRQRRRGATDRVGLADRDRGVLAVLGARARRDELHQPGAAQADLGDEIQQRRRYARQRRRSNVGAEARSSARTATWTCRIAGVEHCGR